MLRSAGPYSIDSIVLRIILSMPIVTAYLIRCSFRMDKISTTYSRVRAFLSKLLCLQSMEGSVPDKLCSKRSQRGEGYGSESARLGPIQDSRDCYREGKESR